MSSLITIAEAREKCKSLIARVPRDVLILSIIVLASSLSFGLGYFAGLDAGQGSGITITESLRAPAPVTGPTSGQVVASKNGTKYYLPECAGADRISDANKVWFASIAVAMKAGYAPAANCAGL